MKNYFCMKLKKRSGTSEKTPVNTGASNPLTSSSDVFVAGSDYEVFISFRGPDTRKGFTDHLYNSLIGAGIRAFRDNEELRVGEEIGENLLDAITKSQICIPIFSKDYASSKWCLKEMAHMLKSKNQLVLPIFYDVTPHQVKHQSGTYEKAFKEHSKRYDKKTVEGWRNALAKIGALKGWDLQNEANGHEGALVNLVVSEVSRKLKKAHLVVDDNITGLEVREEEVIKLLKVGGDDVRMVVLHGIGGIGKTTLAKTVYNQLCERFECCSFLDDIHGTSSHLKGLEKLQNQLVTDILKHGALEREFASVDEGIKVLSERLRGKKVLILLDNVGQRNQMNALAAKGCWFGEGSRIIITCRNTEELDKSQLAGTYEVEGLPSHDALVLFCKHAFKRDSPEADFIDLSNNIVSMTGGFPLALQVIGSLLFDEPSEEWEKISKELKGRPEKKVEDTLIISYEALGDGEKEMFLDIACFFIGADWNVAAHMWEICGFYPHRGIKVLLARSLVKLRDGNKIWMHEQIKDLGREIVRRENLQVPGERSRLWRNEEAKDVLLSQKGTEKIAAMSIDYGFGVDDNYFESECFTNLSNLRYLQLSNAYIVGDFDIHLSKLSWMHWNCCPVWFPSYVLHLNNLLVLEISESNITDGWEGWSSMQIGEKLKALILRSCWCLTKTPKLSDFPALETLILENCIVLSYVDPSIGELKNLMFLSLKNCFGLRELPEQPPNLVELHIDGSGVQELPDLKGLEKLKVLSANGCMHLRHIPQSINHLRSHLKLILDGTRVCTLPDSVGALMKLTCLSLRGCKSLGELPDSIGQLKSLKELCLSGASVRTLPDSIGELKNLQVFLVDRTAITKLPSTLEMLDKLEVLDASYCGRLSIIETLCPLVTLKLNSTRITMLPTSISRLSCLETLELLNCDALQTLPHLPNGLRSLLVTCRPIVTFLDLNSMILMELRLISCWNLKKIPSLGSLIFLKILMVSRCCELVELDGLEELIYLRNLSFVRCEKLSRVEGLGELESLEFLKIENCQAIQGLLDLSKSRKLKELILASCENLKELKGLEDLKSLKRVDIADCSLLYHYTKKWPDIPWDELSRTLGVRPQMGRAMDLLEIGTGDVRILGICGMIGIGKTTLAKIIYNQLLDNFAYHSFIPNISCQSGDLKELQRLLVSDILGPALPQKFKFASVDEGKLVLMERLRGKKVLIVLDDVDKRSQLHVLVPRENLLAPGSIILITCRDRTVVDVSPSSRIYELNTMQSSDALVLFCAHAFGRNTPPADFVTLSEGIVALCEGLPLALKIIGSFLRGRDKDVWVDALKDLMAGYFPEDIFRSLRRSYDTLYREQKQIFLDVACFLDGTDARIAVYMWEDCGFSSEWALNELISKYLIDIRNYTLWMHNMHRNLGREIVRGERGIKLAKRSRLWQTKEVREIFDDQEKSEKIEAICLDYETGSEDCCFMGKKFRRLSNLRFLRLNKANIAGDFNMLLPNLRWLCWHCCPVELMVTNLYLKKLVILDLSESDITDQWNGWRFMQTATNLKVLILKSCQNLTKTPDSSGFPMLERLYLDGCTRLNHLDLSIGNLKKLVFLSVKGCFRLKDQLPQVLSSLKASTELHVEGP